MPPGCKHCCLSFKKRWSTFKEGWPTFKEGWPTIKEGWQTFKEESKIKKEGSPTIKEGWQTFKEESKIIKEELKIKKEEFTFFRISGSCPCACRMGKRAGYLGWKKTFFGKLAENNRKSTGNPSEMQNKNASLLFQTLTLRIAGV